MNKMGASVIVILVGLPGVGKTTFSKSCKAILQEHKVTIFHYDELCRTFSTDERKNVLHQVEIFIIKSQDEDNTNVIIIDDNNYYKSMRDEYVKLCRKFNLGCLIAYFGVSSLELVLDRNLNRNINDQVPEDIIIDMYYKFEAPRSEKSVQVVCINVDNGPEYDFNLFCNKIIEASNNPLAQTGQHVVVSMPQSQLQKVDLALRRIVHRKIIENKSRAKEFNLLKKDLYTKICREEIELGAFDSREDEDCADAGCASRLENELGQYFV